MEIKIITHQELRSERAKLLSEVQHWLTKITKLNARYSRKLRLLQNKIAEIEKQLGD